MKLNEDKCHLLISNHDEDVSAITGDKLSKGKTSKTISSILKSISKLCQKVSMH